MDSRARNCLRHHAGFWMALLVNYFNGNRRARHLLRRAERRWKATE
ncbi:MAG: hypothetical protein AVDCRST_MAG59-4638 [uncultured Thermomicrobiales bacterium]|uniref:Uncharacterized protein n=1 Tax=uncultured Thermomicrobiales bacterium TaxID=1645740 RepID=A0A6J4VI89_9BACT|nr:MAG: hypothetical protein AVDCRST_MAG59-4638 [uncultured Thermomicrobiales bacterium]